MKMKEELKLKLGVCKGRHEIPGLDGNLFKGELSPEEIKNPALLKEQAKKQIISHKQWDIINTFYGGDPENPFIDGGEMAFPFDGEDIYIYATGLTVAVLAAIEAAKELISNGSDISSITVMHYDRESGEYYPQEITS